MNGPLSEFLDKHFFTQRIRIRGSMLALALWLSVGAIPGTSHAQAGSTVRNTAQLTGSINGVSTQLRSNTVELILSEILNVGLTTPATSLPVAPDVSRVIPFTLFNLGNGQEAFLLAGSVDGGDVILEGIAIDRDSDGRFDAAIDTLNSNAWQTPILAPGASLALLALVRGGSSTTPGVLVVSATAATGSGTPGTSYAGEGDGGNDAIVGATTATVERRVALTLGAATEAPVISVLKSQQVSSPGGGNLPVRGATVTYTVETRFVSGTASAAILSDPVPAGTSYVANSLRVDGTTLTDASDADAGGFDGSAVHVALGDVAAPITRTIQFQVTIQ